MRRDEFLMLLDGVHAVLRRLTDTKGVEYPQSEDQLANFKRLAATLGMTPEAVLWVYLEKHLDAIRFHVKHVAAPLAPPSEPVTGRVHDAILYMILLLGLEAERELERNRTR